MQNMKYESIKSCLNIENLKIKSKTLLANCNAAINLITKTKTWISKAKIGSKY